MASDLRSSFPSPLPRSEQKWLWQRRVMVPLARVSPPSRWKQHSCGTAGGMLAAVDMVHLSELLEWHVWISRGPC
ncbi:unnamed protein product [Lampetra fluviatilis]